MAQLLLCFALLLPLCARAEEPPYSLSELLEGLARHVSGTVSFSEVRHLSYLTEPLNLEGTLTFEPPARLERLVRSPTRERMVFDGDVLTIHASRTTPPARALLSDYPALDGFITALRAVLAGDQDTLDRIYETSLRGSEASWSLHLAPRPEPLRAALREVNIEGAAHRITRVEVLEAGGDRSTITLHEPP